MSCRVSVTLFCVHVYNLCRCAGKKLHDVLCLAQNQNEFVIARFKEECCKHAQLRHPNIVQLLGIYNSSNSNIPMLIMEYLPFSLSKCLQEYKDIPMPIKCSILLDVSLGLRYLHEQTPPILHRDLTANNVMLTADMKAKIADLGQAKILDIEFAQLTVAPGTSCYMPPEALVQSPNYDATMDIFSFGVLIIHTVIQTCPIPSEAYVVDPNVPGRCTPLSEVGRRRSFFQRMGDSNALTPIAKQCLDIDPRLRPKLVDITATLKELMSGYGPIRNTIETSCIIEDHEKQIASLESSLQDVKLQIKALLQEIESKVPPTQAEISLLMKQLKSISYADISEKVQKESQLVVVCRTSEDRGANHPIKITRSLSNTAQPTTVIQPPLNISFTGTHHKNILNGLKSPVSVAVDEEGKVYVCDKKGWKGVHIYNPNDDSIKEVVDSATSMESSTYVADEKCWEPSGITLDQSGNILLSDTGSQRVLKFSPEGKLLASVGTKYTEGKGNGEFSKPKGIAVDSNGNVLVCDKDNHRVQVFDSNLRFIRAFGGYGSGKTKFRHPRDIAFDSARNIYIVDTSNYCVKVFTPDFKPLRQIGSEGNQYYHFRAPMNICIDQHDFVYVTDEKKHCVMVFDPTGKFKMSFGNYAKYTDGFFNHPLGIAVDALGRVYVCDQWNGRIQVFV